MLRRIQSLALTPSADLLVGLLLVATSIDEVWEGLGREMLEPGGLGAHHGILVLGVHALMRSVPEVMEGISRIGKG